MKLFLLINTIKFLKLKQISYRMYYMMRKQYRKLVKFSYIDKKINKLKYIELLPSISSFRLFKNTSTFVFLNKEKKFTKKVDWNFNEYGKLWLYNLNYFDFLQQEDISKNDGLKLISDFIANSKNVKDGMMPFPISLRGINWIKFLTYHSIEDDYINSSLYNQYYILLDNLEYHILGNHLLENGFSLLFGAYYFDDIILYKKAKEILIAELDEQILLDGAHFELSPMYHQIMLFRVLECINLLQSNPKKKDDDLLLFLKDKALLMLGWLDTITFRDNSIPLLNDSTNNIAPTSKELFEYANRLDIRSKEITLKESGYRKFETDSYECVVDVGNIGPDYIPGHAHADTFNFVLQLDNKPCIVDTGLSTYETNDRRTKERSTSSHNTVEVNGNNQSEVWGGFRVANRAKIINLKESTNYIEATHNGYEKIGVVHTRKFIFEDKKIVIEDILEGKTSSHGISYLHFHPSIECCINKNTITFGRASIKIKNSIKIEKENYFYADEFNKLKEAKKIKIYFKNNLKMEIKI